jgi:hypothetical protein
MQRNRDPRKVESLEERRIHLHNQLLDALDALGIPFADRDNALACACHYLNQDQLAFGEQAWVYCAQHRTAHLTGWCTVSNDDKIGLGLMGTRQADAARAKCEAWGFPLNSR